MPSRVGVDRLGTGVDTEVAEFFAQLDESSRPLPAFRSLPSSGHAVLAC